MKCNLTKLICLVLVAMLLVATALPALAASKERPKGAYVVEITQPRDRLRVHETPEGGEDNVVDYLEDGTVVVYQSTEEGWWYVLYRYAENDIRGGYVFRDYLKSVLDDKGSKYTGTDNLYVRSEPVISDEYIIGKLKRGVEATIIDQDGTWCKIKYGKKTGWVSAKYLVRVK